MSANIYDPITKQLIPFAGTQFVGAPSFEVNYSTGELIYNIDAAYDFTINTTTGELEWEVSV